MLEEGAAAKLEEQVASLRRTLDELKRMRFTMKDSIREEMLEEDGEDGTNSRTELQ